MLRIAAAVGYSETAFAAPIPGGWRVRYFAPESEVPFCGHATIALGAALALRHGDGTFALKLNAADITVEGRRAGRFAAGPRCSRRRPAAPRPIPPWRTRPWPCWATTCGTRTRGFLRPWPMAVPTTWCWP